MERLVVVKALFVTINCIDTTKPEFFTSFDILDVSSVRISRHLLSFEVRWIRFPEPVGFSYEDETM